jgi:hypothetical protein
LPDVEAADDDDRRLLLNRVLAPYRDSGRFVAFE